MTPDLTPIPSGSYVCPVCGRVISTAFFAKLHRDTLHRDTFHPSAGDQFAQHVAVAAERAAWRQGQKSRKVTP